MGLDLAAVLSSPSQQRILGQTGAPANIHFKVGPYQSLTVETWAICTAVMSVSHARLDRVSHARAYISESLSDKDLLRIEEGIRHAVGILNHGGA
jgi:uncharacterized protein YifN (PemK superfamily)